MTVKTYILAASCAALTLSSCPAFAAPVFYAGTGQRAAFASAVAGGSITTEGFEGITTRTSNNIGYVPEGATFSRNGLSITGSFGGTSVLDTTYLNGGNQVASRFGAATGSVFDTNYGDLAFAFATPVTAFALDLATIARGFVGASSGTFTLTVNGASGSYAYSGSSGFGFFGVTSDTAFSSLTISTSKTYDTELDNVQFGTLASVAAAVPEASSWAMMMVGLGVAGGALRRRRSISPRVTFA